MAASTSYGETPWSVGELAALHELRSGSRARDRQEQIEAVIAEALAPWYVARRTRADQAAASIVAFAERVCRMIRNGDGRVVRRLTHLVKLAYDHADSRRMESMGKRFPGERPSARKQRQELIA